MTEPKSKQQLERERAQAYYALEELCECIRVVEEELQPMLNMRARLQKQFATADRALAKVTKVNVNTRKRNYLAPGKSTIKVEFSKLASQFTLDELKSLMRQGGIQL